MSERRWVRLWFVAIGDLDRDTLVGSFRAPDETIARQYRDALQDRRGLRVTIDPIPKGAEPARDLPAQQLWTLTPC